MITGFIKGQALQISSPLIVASSIDYLEAKFAFQTGDWDDLEKWAHFTCGGVSHVLRLKDDKIGREMHLNLFVGVWKVYIHGTGKNGMRITTNEAELLVSPTGAENDEVFPTIPPSVAEQVALDAREARETAEQLMSDTQIKLEELNESAETARAAAKKANDATAETHKLADDVAKNEEIRQSNEETRQSNERARQNQEAARISEFSEFRREINNLIEHGYMVIDDASYITQSTKEQLEITKDETAKTQEATNKANAATEETNTAITNANEAASKANASATEADTATSNANAATDRADTATQNAATATEQANEATINAQDATLNADRATDNANEAASRANEAAQGINNKFANALKGKASGEAVVINDVCPIEHAIDAKVKSKNLIPFPYEDISKTRDGITWTINEDRSIAVVGEVTGDGVVYTSFILTSQNPMEDGKTYILSPYLFLSYILADGTIKYLASTEATQTITWKKEYKFQYFYYQMDKAYGAVDRLLFPYVVENKYNAEYAPYVDASTVKVKAQGKNLFDISKVNIIDNSMYNVCSIVEVGENYIKIKTPENYPSNGNGYTSSGKQLKECCPQLKVGDVVTLSYDKDKTTAYGYIYLNIPVLLWYVGQTQIITEDMLNSNVTFYGSKVSNDIVTLSNFQIELGTEVTEYSPYVEPTEYAVNADGTIDNLYSIYPTTTLIADTPNVTIEAEYNKDANKVVASLEDRIAALEAMIINY